LKRKKTFPLRKNQPLDDLHKLLALMTGGL
jgi:hypothetical protein